MGHTSIFTGHSGCERLEKTPFYNCGGMVGLLDILAGPMCSHTHTPNGHSHSEPIRHTVANKQACRQSPTISCPRMRLNMPLSWGRLRSKPCDVTVDTQGKVWSCRLLLVTSLVQDLLASGQGRVLVICQRCSRVEGQE